MSVFVCQVKRMSSLRPFSRQLLQLASRRLNSVPPVSTSHSSSTISKSCFNSSVQRLRKHPRSTNQILSLRHVTSSSDTSDPSAEAKARGRRIQVITGSLTALFGASYILYRQLNAEGEESAKEEVGVAVGREGRGEGWQGKK